MIAARKQAYLDALAIPVWVRKDLPDRVPQFRPAGLAVGPGTGQVLMICARVEQPSAQIASDIARSLKYEPVWAWLSAQEPAVAMADAVVERLFTTIIIFGKDVASALFDGQPPTTVHSARLLVVPATEELQASPSQRKVLWRLLCNSQLAGSRQSPGAG